MGLWGSIVPHLRNDQRQFKETGVEAITALAIQHNGLLSPHHQSLSESTPPTHTLCSNTHTQVCTNKCLCARLHSSESQALWRKPNYAAKLE